MKALTWESRQNVALRHVRDPKLLRPDDVIIKITTAAICGSDLHLYNGYVPSMRQGDILGHENMGEVVEVGASVKIESWRQNRRSLRYRLWPLSPQSTKNIPLATTPIPTAS